MSAARLLLVRHGVTDWNRSGRFQGHLDPPLAADGRIEAELLADRLAAGAEDERPTRVIASGLARAHETGRIIAERLAIPLALDRRLIEIGQGEWEGRSHAELSRDDAERYAAWRDDPNARPPGAEAMDLVATRTRDAIEAIVADGGIPCVVTHGGILRVLASHLLELGARGWDLDADNASLSVLLRIDDVWRLDRWNDVHHLLGRVATHVDEEDGQPLAL